MRTTLLSLLCGIIFIGAFSLGAQAQATERKLITVKGRIVDENNQPLSRAEIHFAGTTGGFVADDDGRFCITVPELSTLIFVYQGKEKVSTTITSTDTLLNIRLEHNHIFYLKPVTTYAYSDTIHPIPNAHKTPHSDLASYYPNHLFISVLDEPYIRQSTLTSHGTFLYGNGNNVPSVPKQDFFNTSTAFDSLIYPEEAKLKGIQDQVLLYFYLDKTGKAHDIHALRPTDPALEQAAIRMVEKAAFTSPRHRGRWVEGRCVLPVNFILKNPVRNMDSIASIPTFTLKGQVTDVYGQPIPYVRILHEGTTNLTGTDNTGKFSTEVYAYERLVIFHTGYVEQRITVQPGDSLTHIKMYPETPHLTGINIEAVSSAKQTKESNGIEYFFGDDLPSFRCDYQKFIEKHLRYPETARKAGIEGEVIASFVIDTEGNITDLCIVRPVSPELDAEALRVIALLPQCKPARHRGKPIPFRYTIGIDFKLKTAGHTQADTLPLPGR